MRASLTDILARKSSRVGQVGEYRCACSAQGKSQDTPTIGEDVRVAVGVGPMEFQIP